MTTLTDARAENVRAFFEPASIAVVGASANESRGGNRILHNLLVRFDGPVYAVNPNLTEVLGVPAYPSVAAIPGPVDLAVVLIPAAAVVDVVRDCVNKGVKAVCIESGGFAEADPEGMARQREIEAIAEGTATRLWGPNCAGYVCSAPPLSTSFVVTPSDLTPGNVALVAQSGMMAAALLVQILTTDMFRVSKACSIGNKCDVDESDLLEYMAQDRRTDVIALYLESIGDGRRFLSALDQCNRRAIVVALMGGRTETGAMVALSHTGSIASERAIVSGALRQRGVLEVHDFMELVEVAAALSVLRRRHAGPRVGVLTFSGAAGVVASDLFDRGSLSLARLARRTIEALAAIFPPWFPPTNPLDVWSTVEQAGLARTLAASLGALVDDDGVDSVLLMPLAFGFFDVADLDPMLDVAARSDKPVVAWVFGERDQLDVWSGRLAAEGIPTCKSLAVAVRVLEALAIRDATLRRPGASVNDAPLLDGPRAALWQAVMTRPGPTVGEVEVKGVLASYGLDVVDERLVATVEDAAAAAGSLGYPVVIKLVADGLAHKSEIGAVRLDIGSRDQVRSVAAELINLGAREGLRAPKLLVQSMVGPGTELILGARRDPSFGPVVVLGLGGIFVEQLGDVTVRPAPVTRSDVREMLRELRAGRLLEGGRGRPGADVAAVIGAVLALSAAIVDAPARVQAIEVNPLIVGAVGDGALAVDGLVVLSPRELDDAPGTGPAGALVEEARCPS